MKCIIHSWVKWAQLMRAITSQRFDNRVHRKSQGCILMPNIGYGSKKKTKPRLPSGFRKSLVHNVKELEVLLMCNKSHCAEDAHKVSSKQHKASVERAAQLAIGLSNPNARLLGEENRLCTHCICVKKAIKFCHLAKKKDTVTSSNVFIRKQTKFSLQHDFPLRSQ